MAIVPGSGYFEVCEGDTPVVTGHVMRMRSDKPKDEEPVCRLVRSIDRDGTNKRLTAREVYREFRLRGYEYGPHFQGIISADIAGKNALNVLRFSMRSSQVSQWKLCLKLLEGECVYAKNIDSLFTSIDHEWN